MREAEKLYLGVEIGGTKLQAAIGDQYAKIIKKIKRPSPANKGAEAVLMELSEMIKELFREFKPQRIGVGFGGPVDWKQGIVAKSHQVRGWEGFPLKKWINELTGLDVIVENDANTAALAEAKIGAGRGKNPVFYVTLGSGVGGGLIIDGKIYHGSPPGEAEIGHVLLDRDNTRVEDRCSGWAIDKKIRNGLKDHPQSLLAHIAQQAPSHEARHLLPALNAGDQWAHEILNELVDDLGWALSHVVHLFHPECIVIGGGLSQLGKVLIEQVEASLIKYVMKAFQPPPSVLLSNLGEDVVPMGALLLAAGLSEEP